MDLGTGTGGKPAIGGGRQKVIEKHFSVFNSLFSIYVNSEHLIEATALVNCWTMPKGDH